MMKGFHQKGAERYRSGRGKGQRPLRREKTQEKSESRAAGRLAGLPALLGTVILMFGISGLMLLGLSALVYYAELPATAVHIGIMVTYVVSAFLGGFVIGKRRRRKKFAKGAAVGLLYFAVLLVLSLVAGGGTPVDPVQLLIVLVLTVLPAMIGAMLA